MTDDTLPDPMVTSASYRKAIDPIAEHVRHQLEAAAQGLLRNVDDELDLLLHQVYAEGVRDGFSQGAIAQAAVQKVDADD